MEHVGDFWGSVLPELHDEAEAYPRWGIDGVFRARELWRGRGPVDVEDAELDVVDVEVMGLAVSVFDLPNLHGVGRHNGVDAAHVHALAVDGVIPEEELAGLCRG